MDYVRGRRPYDVSVESATVDAIKQLTSRQGASRRAGLILIHRFPLSLLFHNHRPLPVPIRGYKCDAYNMPVQLLYRPALNNTVYKKRPPIIF